MSGGEGRVMPNVLTMPASQVRDPVKAFILMEAHDLTGYSRRL